jgi:hypothetical protein
MERAFYFGRDFNEDIGQWELVCQSLHRVKMNDTHHYRQTSGVMATSSLSSSGSSGKTLIDEKYEKYRQCQSDIQQLFLSKQQYLSQFNENTLVKGVCLPLLPLLSFLPPLLFLSFLLSSHHDRNWIS